MIPDSTVPLRDDMAGCSVEDKARSIQNGSEVYTTSLNPEWLSLLCIREQGAPTIHSLATRPVEVHRPAIIVQPAEEVLQE